MDILLGIAAIVIGYLLGGFPIAYIVARLRKGIDIREVGVRNMGAGNTIREIGKWEGAIVAIVDIGKGTAVIYIALALEVSLPWVLGAGAAAILGHAFPVYIGFRGGQGAATIIGIFFALAPEAMAITLIPLAIVLYFTKDTFASIFVVSPVLPALVWIFESSLILTVYALGVIGFVIFRNKHRLNEVKAIFVKNKE
jgi:glycerol-3-phosphate acyltransferase PlsY